MSVAKPGVSTKKRHKVKLHASQPPTKKVKSAPSSKHLPVEKAFEQPAGQPKKIEFKLTEAISNIFESAAYHEMAGTTIKMIDQTTGRLADQLSTRPKNERMTE